MKKSIIILFMAIGIILILIGYNQKKERISNFQDNNANITVIDLSKEKTDYFDYYLISGILFISIGLFISMDVFKRTHVKDETTPLEQLTTQEKRVVHLIHEGKSNKEIADELSVSISTVKTHTNNIYKKLGVNSRPKLLNLLKK